MWLPLYNNFAYGGSPGINYSLSVANKPVFSDGDKTVTITMKPGLQVERRQARRRPGSAVRHRADQGRGRRERRQLGIVHAGLLPGQPRQRQRAKPVHGRDASEACLQPRLLPQQPARASTSTRCRAKTGTSRRPAVRTSTGTSRRTRRRSTTTWARPAVRSGRSAATRCGRSPTGRSCSRASARVTASWTMKANPDFGGTPKPYASTIQGVTYTGITPMLNAMRTGSLDIGIDRLLPARRRLQPEVPGLQRVRAARLRLGRRHLELQEHRQPLRQDHLPALLPPGDGDARRRAGDHRRDLPRRRGARLRPGPVGPEDAVRAGQRGQPPVSRTTRPRRCRS